MHVCISIHIHTYHTTDRAALAKYCSDKDTWYKPRLVYFEHPDEFEEVEKREYKISLFRSMHIDACICMCVYIYTYRNRTG